MKIFIGGRRSGKTSKIIRWWLENPTKRVVVCMNETQAKDIRSKVRRRVEQPSWGEKMLDIARLDDRVYKDGIIHMNQLHELRGRDVEIGVEDIDELIHRWFNQSVSVATMTAEEWVE